MTITLSSRGFAAEIAVLGAELVALRDDAGRDWLWDGDPAWWAGRAPLLFPMVGRAKDDRIRVKGREYPLPQHGFARRSIFEPVAVTPDRCVLRLVASEATRASYPFDFRLDVAYALDGPALTIAATVANPGAEDLPCSFGFHPAFRWPLPGAVGPHEVRFELAEPAPVRRLKGGLLLNEAFPTPMVGDRLALDPVLFEADALIFDQLRSRKVAFGPTGGGPAVEVRFPGLPDFALWTKPGAPYLCLEPWQGHAAPEGFDGEFAERPGVVRIAPGAERTFAIEVLLAGG